MDSMKEALKRRKMKGLELVISIQPANEENEGSDLAPEAEEGDAKSEMPMEGEEMVMDDLPEPPMHTRSLRGKADAARFAAFKKKEGKA